MLVVQPLVYYKINQLHTDNNYRKVLLINISNMLFFDPFKKEMDNRSFYKLSIVNFSKFSITIKETE